MEIDNVRLDWLGHSAFRITDKKSGKVLYIDPFQIANEEIKADIILITHDHYDHCSVADIDKIARDGTIIVCTADSQSIITKVNRKMGMQIVEAENEIDLLHFKIKTMPAYSNNEFHKKAEGWVGYIIQSNGTSIYHAGDTDAIKEMEKLTGYNKNNNKLIALLPVSGKFTMDAEEAAKAAELIKPFIAIPMHYGSVLGQDKDAQLFVKICRENGINAEVLEKVK
jgi:L-ascorbate metabolism protein UlaG (beta-lactamase superfamily)